MKVDRTELVYKLVDAINNCSEKRDPSQFLIDMGIAMAKIGKVLKGVPLSKAKAAIQTVYYMNQAGLMDAKEAEEGKR